MSLSVCWRKSRQGPHQISMREAVAKVATCHVYLFAFFSLVLAWSQFCLSRLFTKTLKTMGEMRDYDGFASVLCSLFVFQMETSTVMGCKRINGTTFQHMREIFKNRKCVFTQGEKSFLGSVGRFSERLLRWKEFSRLVSITVAIISQHSWWCL